mmetsp:Transcript_120638/g.341764  ORF Transcript_120638/g.341764 Transcript_120638/m.341764 type:complete len:259 (+) Transcript_120638:64-840(+)
MQHFAEQNWRPRLCRALELAPAARLNAHDQVAQQRDDPLRAVLGTLRVLAGHQVPGDADVRVPGRPRLELPPLRPEARLEVAGVLLALVQEVHHLLLVVRGAGDLEALRQGLPVGPPAAQQRERPVADRRDDPPRVVHRLDGVGEGPVPGEVGARAVAARQVEGVVLEDPALHHPGERRRLPDQLLRLRVAVELLAPRRVEAALARGGVYRDLAARDGRDRDVEAALLETVVGRRYVFEPQARHMAREVAGRGADDDH